MGMRATPAHAALLHALLNDQLASGLDGATVNRAACVAEVAIIHAPPITVYVGSDGSGTVGGSAFADEDIRAFDTSTNSWSLYFDGSDVGATEDVDAFYLESDGTLLLNFLCVPGTLGETTTCTFSLFWNGDTYGFNFYLDSMSIGGLATGATARGLTEETLRAKIYLPLIAR